MVALIGCFYRFLKNSNHALFHPGSLTDILTRIPDYYCNKGGRQGALVLRSSQGVKGHLHTGIDNGVDRGLQVGNEEVSD